MESNMNDYDDIEVSQLAQSFGFNDDDEFNRHCDEMEANADW